MIFKKEETLKILIIATFILVSSCSEEVGLKGGATSRKSVIATEENSSEQNKGLEVGNDFDTNQNGTGFNNAAESDGNGLSRPGNEFNPGNGLAQPGNEFNPGNGLSKPGNEHNPNNANTVDSRIRVGFNYEDTPNTDQDYNDGVLCIEGRYRINYSTNTARSLIDQTATLIFRDGGYNVNTIFVQKYRGSTANPTQIATIYNFQGFSNRPTQIVRRRYNFKAGDYISITYNKSRNNFAAIPQSLGGNKDLIKIEIDICRTAGR